MDFDERADAVERLTHAGLVVRRHHAHDGGVVTRATDMQRVEVHDAVAVDVDVADATSSKSRAIFSAASVTAWCSTLTDDDLGALVACDDGDP